MRSNSLDSKLKAKEVELKRHEQEIADQDEVWKKKKNFIIGYAPLFCTNNMQYLNVQQHYLFRSKYLNSTFFTLPYSDTEGSQNESPGIRDMERAVQEK